MQKKETWNEYRDHSVILFLKYREKNNWHVHISLELLCLSTKEKFSHMPTNKVTIWPLKSRWINLFYFVLFCLLIWLLWVLVVASYVRSEKGFPGGIRRCKKHGFDPWIRKILWSRKWQPTLVFLPGEFHGRRSLVGYSPWGIKESDTAEHTHTQWTWDLNPDDLIPEVNP